MQTELVDNVRLKTASLVRVDSLRYTVMEEPVLKQSLSHCLSRLVTDGMATVYLVKTSVITKTFSRPSLAGSRTVKSTEMTSNGFVANR
ncbi:hypothetical protein ACOMHN_026325 [Nucella lapillus]